MLVAVDSLPLCSELTLSAMLRGPLMLWRFIALRLERELWTQGKTYNI